MFEILDKIGCYTCNCVTYKGPQKNWMRSNRSFMKNNVLAVFLAKSSLENFLKENFLSSKHRSCILLKRGQVSRQASSEERFVLQQCCLLVLRRSSASLYPFHHQLEELTRIGTKNSVFQVESSWIFLEETDGIKKIARDQPACTLATKLVSVKSRIHDALCWGMRWKGKTWKGSLFAFQFRQWIENLGLNKLASQMIPTCLTKMLSNWDNTSRNWVIFKNPVRIQTTFAHQCIVHCTLPPYTWPLQSEV